MKILVCVSEYYPKGSGIANVAYNVVNHLQSKGIDCVVCSPTGPDIRLGSIGEFGLISLIYFWYEVKKYFKDEKTVFDGVWLHNPLFISKNTFDNSLVTIHTTTIGKRRRQYPWKLHIYYFLSSIIEKYCFKKIDENTQFTIVDPTVEKELLKIGVNKEKISYIPNGVETNLFKPIIDKKTLRKDLGLPVDDILLICVGRITPAKQPLKLIKIFSKLTNEIKNITLIVVGNGDLLNKTKKLVESENLKNVKFLGRVRS